MSFVFFFLPALAGNVAEFVRAAGDRNVDQVSFLQPLPRERSVFRRHVFLKVENEDERPFQTFGFVNRGEDHASRVGVGKEEVDFGDEVVDGLGVGVERGDEKDEAGMLVENTFGRDVLAVAALEFTFAPRVELFSEVGEVLCSAFTDDRDESRADLTAKDAAGNVALE